MRYEIAVLLKALDDYHSRTGGYHPVDTATMEAAIEETRDAYRRNPPDLHEETLIEIICKSFCFVSKNWIIQRVSVQEPETASRGA